MSWSKHAPHGLTFSQRAAADRDYEAHKRAVTVGDVICDCDVCIERATERKRK